MAILNEETAARNRLLMAIDMEKEGGELKVIPFSDIHKRREIDRGSTSIVYEAELKPMGLTVAFKEIFIDDIDRELLCEEGRLLAQLHHPNIVSLYGVAAGSMEIEQENKPQNLYNLVMEYMPDGNLYDALQKDPNFVFLPWRSRVLIALQVAEAMEYMHSVGIIYFDTRTPNVLLDLTDPNQPVAKLCDFGIASKKDGDMEYIYTLGANGRMAPEVVVENVWPLTEKVDVFTFGVLMHKLVTGKDRGIFQVMNDEQVHFRFFRTLRHGHPAVPEWCFYPWMELMKDCMVCEVSWRPPFSEVVGRLRYMLDAIYGSLERTESCSSNHCDSLDDYLISPLEFTCSSQCLSYSAPELVS